MKTIDTLIRLAKSEVDDLGRVLADIEARRAAALQRVIDLDAHVAQEQVIAARHALAGAAYGGFARAAMDDRRALLGEVERFETEAGHVRELLQAAFVELKKVETLAEQRQARAASERAKREGAQLDETAITRAARRG